MTNYVLPKYIDFGFHKILVERISEEEMWEEAECEEGDMIPEGLWDTDTGTIFLLRNLNTSNARYYLMHEVIHAALDLMDSLDRKGK